MLDVREQLEAHQGTFVNRDCLFVSTTNDNLLTDYVNCEVLFPFFDIMDTLTRQLVTPFLDRVEGFICPATGDIVLLEHATKIANMSGIPTTAVWADKQPDNSYRVKRNGFATAIRDRRVVVLNDRICLGGTTLKIIAEARRLGCEVLGVATLAGVSTATPERLGVTLVHQLCTIDVRASFLPDEIPSEYQTWPIVVDEPLGHGADFHREHPDYEGGFTTLLS